MKELQNLNNSAKKILVVLPINKMEEYLLSECAYSLVSQTYPIDLLVLQKGLSQDDLTTLKSILDQPKISISEKNEAGETIQKEIEAEKKINYTIEETTSDNFAKLFNEGFNYSLKNGYEFYSMIEFDDVIDFNWYSNVLKYAETLTEITGGFLPLTREISNGAFLGFFNEAPWVENLADVPGIYDLTLLTKYNCMNITGSVFKTEGLKKFAIKTENSDYLKAMKENIKINSMQEFFLRMVYKDLKFYSVPRLGYEHRVDRPTKIVDYFSSKLPRDLVSRSKEFGGISPAEYTFWNQKAKSEYYYPKERELNFVEA